MKSIFALILLLSSAPAFAITSCDLLMPASERSFLVHPNKVNIFVVKRGRTLHVYKGWDIETIPDDLKLADYIFRKSKSKVFKANLVLDEVEIPSPEIPLEIIPEPTREFFGNDLVSGKVEVNHSRFIDGRIPYEFISDIPVNERKEMLEEHRIFNSEAERLLNWVRSTGPSFRGHPIKATLAIDALQFLPELRDERQNALRLKMFIFEAGENSIFLGYGENFVIRNGKFILIDPH